MSAERPHATRPLNTRPGGQDREAPLLEAVGITSGYDGIPAVREVSLHVRPGEVVALLGANGAGKTPPLFTLAGEVRLPSGEVRWCGAKARVPLVKLARAS